MYLFSPKLPYSRTAVISSRLPLPLARAFTAVVWAFPYFFNTQQLRSTIAPSIAKATGATGWRKHVIGVSGAIAFGRYISDFAFFLHRPAAEIRKRVTRRTEFGDVEQLVLHHKAGLGAILVSSNFSCFYYALTTGLPQEMREMELVVVQPERAVQGEAAQLFKQKISSVMGKEFKIIESGTLRAGIEMTAALKRGCLVACLIDFFPPNNASFAITKFLNQPSCQPTGISAIAALTGAPVIPFFTFYEQGKFVTRFSDAIMPPRHRGDTDGILNMCNAIDLSLSRVILARPREWAAWISVPPKWNTAASLLGQLMEEDNAAV